MTGDKDKGARREQFEARFRARGYAMHYEDPFYTNSLTQAAWIGWQAAIDSAAQPAPVALPECAPGRCEVQLAGGKACAYLCREERSRVAWLDRLRVP